VASVIGFCATLLFTSPIASISVTLWLAVNVGNCGNQDVELNAIPWKATSAGLSGSPAVSTCARPNDVPTSDSVNGMGLPASVASYRSQYAVRVSSDRKAEIRAIAPP
jgi:hypothetical protein